MEKQWWTMELTRMPQRQNPLGGEHSFWLLKDPSANCGRGISVHADLRSLLEEARKEKWKLLVQKYIERPLLLEGRKCDVRLWVVVTSWNPAVVWAWKEPYLRLATRPFTLDPALVTDNLIHLTNRAVQKKSDTKKSFAEDEDYIWLKNRFLEYVEEHGPSSAKEKWVESGQESQRESVHERWNNVTWPRMLAAVRALIRACQDDVGVHHPGSFELFGFDFMLDDTLAPWLLEANSGPDLCEDAGPSLRNLAESAVLQMFRLVSQLHGAGLSLPPAAENGDVDAAVNGAGSYHLILKEETQKSSLLMHRRRRRTGVVRSHEDVLRILFPKCELLSALDASPGVSDRLQLEISIAKLKEMKVDQ
jgi:hypothetical protein